MGSGKRVYNAPPLTSAELRSALAPFPSLPFVSRSTLVEPLPRLSAVLGGVVNLSACVVYAFVLGLGKPASAGATVVALFRAEASKVLVIVLQLWLVLATYRDIVLPAFLATFVITVFLFGMALLVRD